MDRLRPPRLRRMPGTRALLGALPAVLGSLLLSPGCAAQAGPPGMPARSHEEVAREYVRAFNTGNADSLARAYARLFDPGFLAGFGGAAAAAWWRLDLFRTYGPLEMAWVDSTASPPVVWTRGATSLGWVGFQFYLDAGGRVERNTVWRPRPVDYSRVPAVPAAAVGDSLRNYLDRMSAAGLFSGSVVLSRHGRVVLSDARGEQRRGEGRPITESTRFHIASVTKILTATALLRLVEEGVVSLDDTLGRWIPEYPEPYRSRVTVRHLLTHASAIEVDGDADYLREVNRAESAGDLLRAQLRAVAGREPRFEPGSEYDYTSEGIDLLGVVMERATGAPWTEVVRERVLRPAGMAATRFALPREEGDWAVGYTSLTEDLETTTPGTLRPAPEILTRVAKPSSGVWSTAGDLHRFMRALLEGRLLGPALADSLLSPQREAGELPKYGLRTWAGLGAQGEHIWGIRTVGHGGVVPGYSAAIEYVPASGWLLTVTSNTGEATGYLVFQRFLELVAGSSLPRSPPSGSGG